MEVERTDLPGLLRLRPRVFGDDRGFFLETYRAEWLAPFGVEVDFVQSNHSRSIRDTVRGLHFQTDPGQPKLVRVARGRVWDVVVDLRPRSPRFGRWQAFELDDVEHHGLFIPAGFGHGFCVLSEVADFTYQVGSYYDAATEAGVAWDDPEIGVAWPTSTPILSERDRSLPSLAAIRDRLPDVEVGSGLDP